MRLVVDSRSFIAVLNLFCVLRFIKNFISKIQRLYPSKTRRGSGLHRAMCQLRGRKAKAQQIGQLHPGLLFFTEENRRAALGGIRTHGTLLYCRLLTVECLLS